MKDTDLYNVLRLYLYKTRVLHLDYLESLNNLQWSIKCFLFAVDHTGQWRSGRASSYHEILHV